MINFELSTYYFYYADRNRKSLKLMIDKKRKPKCTLHNEDSLNNFLTLGWVPNSMQYSLRYIDIAYD